MTAAELLTDGDFTNADPVKQVNVVATPGGHPSRAWFLSPGPNSGQPPAAVSQQGYLRLLASQGTRLRQALATPQQDVVLRALVRVMSGELLIAAVYGNRPGPTVEVRADDEWHHIDMAVTGPVDQVVLYAATDATVIDVKQISLAENGHTAPDAASAPRAAPPPAAARAARLPAAARARSPKPVPTKPARPGANLVAAARSTGAFWFGRRGVREFFDAHPEVDLVKSDLTSVPGLDADNVLQRRLQGLQRLARVSAEPAHVDELYRAGYRSASAITRKGRAAFIAAHGDALGGRAKAAAVYEKAAHVSSRAMAVYARFSPAFNRNLPRVLAAAADDQEIPDWRKLFPDDQLDLVTDDPSRTVFSQAAYLTDLLHFLEQLQAAPSAAPAQNGIDVLARTRSDLLYLALDQANTNVELPMLDLVNELLECAVLAENPLTRQPAWCTSVPPADTTATAAGTWPAPAAVSSGDPAPWDPTNAASYHQTPAAAGYHAHGFTAAVGQPGLPLAPGDLFGVWVRPQTTAPPTQIVLTVSFAAGSRQLVWGYTPDDPAWTAAADAIALGPIPPLCSWRYFTVTAAELGIDGQAVTGLEFGCVDGAVDWGPAGSYPAAPPTTTTGDSAARTAQPQVVFGQAYDVIGGDVFPWSIAPLDLGNRTARLAAGALGVDLAEMVAAFTAPDLPAELQDISIATTVLDIGPQLQAILLGRNANAEQVHWGFQPGDTGWVAELQVAKTFLARTGLTAAQMRTPPGSVTIPGLALQARGSDPDLVISGLTETTLPLLRRFLRLWGILGGDYGQLERFYYSLADTDQAGGKSVGDILLTRLALARRLTGRTTADLLTMAAWWTPTLDAGGYVDATVYPDDGPGSIASSPYSKTFLNPALGDVAATFKLDGSGDDGGGEIVNQIPLTSAFPAISAALRVTVEDLALLVDSSYFGVDPPAAGTPPVLTIQTLSAIYRAVTFTQAAGLSMADYLSMRELTGIDPFDPAALPNTQLFLDAVDDVASSGLTIAELDYLLGGTIRAGSDFSPGPPDDLVATITAGLTKLWQVHDVKLNSDGSVRSDPTDKMVVVVPDPNGDVLKRELAASGSQLPPDDVLAAVDGTAHYTVALATDPGLADADAELLSWSKNSEELTSLVVLTSDNLTELQNGHPDATFQAAVQDLYQKPRDLLAGVRGLDASTVKELIDTTPSDQRHAYVLKRLVPVVVDSLGTALIVAALAARSNLNSDLVSYLLAAIQDDTGKAAGQVLLGLSGPSAPDSPPTTQDAAASIVTHFDKIARICAVARLGVAETQFTLDNWATLGWLNLLSLPAVPTTPAGTGNFTGWQRLTHYAAFRDRVGDYNGTLTGTFGTAISLPSGTADAAAQDTALTEISNLTGWPKGTLTALHQPLRLTYPDDYRDERALLRMERAMAVVRTLGADPARIAGWCSQLADTATGSDLLAAAHAATRANPAILQPIEDELRRVRRDALLNHWCQATAGPGQADTDPGDMALAHFFIDTEVDVNRITTRIAAATQAIQLLVQRSLLDLDDRLVLTDDARTEWSWYDSYTSWSAARQTFVYPENYVVPDARTNSTPQFASLQSQLQNGQLTDASAQTAILGYLQNLDDIGNLTAAALYQETQTDSTTNDVTGTVLHLVARTKATPYHYYYRQGYTPGGALSGTTPIWTAWEDVGVEIDSENIALYVLDRRLHLFWLQVSGHVDQPTSIPPQPQPGDLTPPPLYEARLAWTTRDLSGWTAKQLSVDSLSTYDTGSATQGPDLLYLGVRFSAPGKAVPTLSLPVRLSFERNLLGGSEGPEELSIFDFVGDEQQATVSTPVEQGKIFYTAPTGRSANLDSPDPAVNGLPVRSYQSWLVSGGLVLEQIAAEGQIATFTASNEIFWPYPGVPLPLPESMPLPPGPYRILGATSPSSFAAGTQYGLDPTLPFTCEPPGFPMIAEPTGQTYDVQLDGRTFTLLTYRFELAYHPYVKSLKRVFATSGVGTLFTRETQLQPGSLLSDRTALDFTGLSPTASVVNPDLAEKLDFSSGGFYSAYNWELFFHVPRLIGRQLCAAQRFDEAKKWFEYIFDPLDRTADSAPQKYWQTNPLYGAASEPVSDLLKSLAGDSSAQLNVSLAQADKEVTTWLSSPFDPDMIAVLRPEAYQKATVMDYLDNLIAWGDSYFAQATSETLAAATQLYLFASDLLGPAPLPGPVPGPATPQPGAVSYTDLRGELDQFADPVVSLENVLPASTGTPSGSQSATDGPPPSAVLSPGLYFAVPPNPKLQGYWTTVADRLAKLREGLSITGQPLQTPPIPALGNPANFLRAGIASSAPGANARPVYRFPTLIAKAQELAGDVRSLGAALLSALEKQDAESLAALRSTQELTLLQKARVIKESAVTEAQQQVAQLQDALAATAYRQNYYSTLLSQGLSEAENDQVAHLQTSAVLQAVASGLEAIGTGFAFVPEATIGISGAASSPVITASIGGRELEAANSLVARVVSMTAGIESHLATMASLSGGWARRSQDWQFQAGLAQLEMIQINAQIAAAQTRQAQAQQELDDHDRQIANAQQVDDFLHSKFTNAELYSWMVSQITMVYSNAYRLALATAQRAQDAFRWELLPDQSTFIQPQSAYWNSLRSGLLAGEQLGYDLRQLETAFYERNARQLEITKHISLAMAAPDALLALRSTGKCTVTIPEAWFDLDYPGHYLRRIRRVAISVPCVTGPYTGVHCTLSLLSDQTRVDPSLLDPPVNQETYIRAGAIDDFRFVDRYGLTESIVTSGGLDQSGTFTAGGDDRFDPFEGAGAVSTWQIDLPDDTNAFSLDTVTDVVLHISYTARDAGSAVRDAARQEVVAPLRQVGTLLLTALQDFPQQWQQMLASTADPRVLTLPLTLDRLPATAAPGSVISGLRVYLETASAAELTVPVAVPNGTAGTVSLRPDPSLPGLLSGVLDLTKAPLVPGQLGNWTMQWPAAGLAVAAPVNLMILADYEPPPGNDPPAARAWRAP